MTLITRVGRLFRADLHAVLDRIEEPEALLKQAVREMEAELAHDEQRAKLLRHEQAQLIARQSDLDQSLSEIDEELNVCFASHKDDLAKALIRRKLEAQRFQNSLSRKRSALEETIAELQARLEHNRGRLESMRQKAELLAEEETSGNFEQGWTTLDGPIRDEEVEVAFLREKQRRSHL